MNYKIEKAKLEDRPAIIKVLEPWNMHHIPPVEVKELDMSCFFVVKIDGKIVSVAGYEMLTPDLGKTTLLGVYPKLDKNIVLGYTI